MHTCRASKAHKENWRVFCPAQSPAALFLVQIDKEEHPRSDRCYQMNDDWGGGANGSPWVAVNTSSPLEEIPEDLRDEDVIEMLKNMTMREGSDELLERLDAFQHDATA